MYKILSKHINIIKHL